MLQVRQVGSPGPENDSMADPVVEAPGSHHQEEVPRRGRKGRCCSSKAGRNGPWCFCFGPAVLDQHVVREGHSAPNSGLFITLITVRLFCRATDCLHCHLTSWLCIQMQTPVGVSLSRSAQCNPLTRKRVYIFRWLGKISHDTWKLP